MWCLLSIGFAENLLFTEERSTAFEDVVASEDERWVAMGTGSTGQVHVLDVNNWSTKVVDVCTGGLGGLAFDSTGSLYAGCDESGVVEINPETLMMLSEISVDAGSIYFSSMYNDNLYVLAENPNGGNPRVHLVDLQQKLEQVGGNFPSTLGYGAPKDMERVGNYLIVSHGSTSISKIDPVSGGATRDQQGPTTGSCEDVLPEANASNALVSGGTAGVYRFLFSSNQLQFAGMGSGIEQATALVVHNGQLWVADSTANALKSFTYSAGSATMGTEVLEETSLTINGNIQEMVSVQGYIVGGTETGALFVVGSAPWVEVDDSEDIVLEDETDFSISFTSTESGTYSMLLHATTNDDGIELATGTVTAAVETLVDLTATEDFLEGLNEVRVVVTGESGVGHDTFAMSIDTAPSTPILTQAEVGYGDEEIRLSGTVISDSDVSYYEVYVSTEPFEPSDYAEGGPVWDAENPLRFDVEASDSYEWSLNGLSNDQTYYIALRAFDVGGKFSSMSDVQAATPRNTFSASQLTGEKGQFCGLMSPIDWSGVLLSTMFISFRRRQSKSQCVNRSKTVG